MIQLNGVCKSFNGLPVLHRLFLTANRGEVVGLVGPSGAGKTTLLRLIAGLIQPDAGQVTVASTDLSYVFQEPRLLPWRSALDNVAAALRARSVEGSMSRMVALDWLERVGLVDFVSYFPAQLSGGMQQRVALARAFAVEPDILLLDEPFSHLDDENKQELLDSLRQLVQQTGVTVVYVTHVLSELDGLTSHILHLKPQNGAD